MNPIENRARNGKSSYNHTSSWAQAQALIGLGLAQAGTRIGLLHPPVALVCLQRFVCIGFSALVCSHCVLRMGLYALLSLLWFDRVGVFALVCLPWFAHLFCACLQKAIIYRVPRPHGPYEGKGSPENIRKLSSLPCQTASGAHLEV